MNKAITRNDSSDMIPSASTVEKKSFCRFCTPCCGTVLRVDENDRIVDVRGDREDLFTRGYICIKGLQADATHHNDNRVLHPLKRQPDGSFKRIALDQALDEIAAKLQAVIDADGPDAVGGFRGGGAILNASSESILKWFLEALGSANSYSPFTIDQSAKMISVGRLGIWAGGRQSLETSDIRLFFGANPLVSLATNDFEMANPSKTMKEMRARGLKLIVIDPRYTETARYADVFLQPYPGEDPTIAAGLIHIILNEGWHDADFCQRYVADLAELTAAVAPFTPDYVARRAGVDADDLVRAAALFARDSKRGMASSGTGPNMAMHSNLAEHLIECLNVICGRYPREGDQVPNPGVFTPREPKTAEVIPAPRWWEQGPKSRVGGYGTLNGERMSGIMCDEILTPGKGQIRAFIAHGSNIVNIMPDQQKTLEALKSLELLVSVEPYLNETAKLSHYVLPTTLYYERPDLTRNPYEQLLVHKPYARYTPAIVKPPEGAEVVDDWTIFWELARRLDLNLAVDGVPLDMKHKPRTDDVLEILSRRLPMPFAEFKQLERGKVFDEHPQYVEAGNPDNPGRFTTAPPDVAAELAQVAEEPLQPGLTVSNGETFRYRMSTRRIREIHNSTGRNIAALRERAPYNLAYLNPAELTDLGLAAGDKATLVSDRGRIPVRVEADATVRRGVVSMAHGFGRLPEENEYDRDGSNPNILISTDRDLDPINAMPRMTAIPLNIETGWQL